MKFELAISPMPGICWQHSYVQLEANLRVLIGLVFASIRLHGLWLCFAALIQLVHERQVAMAMPMLNLVDAN
jgi:hypothetical protein